MIFSLYIYMLMAGVLIGLCYVGSRNKQFKYVVMGIACYALIMGLRYNVGIDYLAYYQLFKNASQGVYLIDLERTEFGFKLLTKLIANITSLPVFYFSCVAFFQIFLYFYIFKDKPLVWGYIAFCFITMCTWLNFANTLRQFIAASILVYSLTYVCSRNLLKFLLCIVIASLFHKAVLVFIIIYPTFRYGFKSVLNKYVAIGIILISVCLSYLNLINNYLTIFETVATALNYDGYLNGRQSVYMDVKVNRGFGFFLILLMNLTIAWYGKKICTYYNDRLITIIFYLFIFGLSFGYITILNQMFSRLMLYISSYNFLLYGLVLAYLNKVNKNAFYIFLIPPIILFLGTIANADQSIDGSAYFRLIFDYL